MEDLILRKAHKITTSRLKGDLNLGIEAPGSDNPINVNNPFDPISGDHFQGDLVPDLIGYWAENVYRDVSCSN